MMKEEKNPVNAYAEMIRRARNSNSGEFIRNHAPQHAKYVIKELFEHAIVNKNDIRIVSSELGKNCYNDDIMTKAERLDELNKKNQGCCCRRSQRRRR